MISITYLNPSNKHARAQEGRDFDRRVVEEAVTDHPPDAGWFCGKHHIHAEKLIHLTLREAIIEMRKSSAS